MYALDNLLKEEMFLSQKKVFLLIFHMYNVEHTTRPEKYGRVVLKP